MEIKQQLRLSQQLVMTPQLQQAIRLLQLSRLELIDEIRKELDANPVLGDEEIDGRPQRKTGTEVAEADFQSTVGGVGTAEGEKTIERLEDRSRQQDPTTSHTDDKRVQDIDWEQFLENRTLQQPLPTTRGGFEELPPIEASL